MLMVDGMRIGFNTASSRRLLMGWCGGRRRKLPRRRYGSHCLDRVPSLTPLSRGERIQMQVCAAQPPRRFAAAQGQPKGGPTKQRPRQPFSVAKVLRHVRAQRDQRLGRGATAQAA